MGISVKYNHSKKANKIYENKEIDWDAWDKEWDRRKNTEFGKLLTKLNEIVFDWFGEYDDYGFKSTPISEIMLEYFDGENNLIGLVNHIKRVLKNYDMMQEDDVRKIINRLNKIAGSNKDKDLLESLIEKYGAKGVEAAINRLNEGVDKSIMDEVNKLCDLFRKYGIHRISNEDPKYKDAIDDLVRRLPIYDKISKTHPHVWFTYSKTSYWRDPIVINLHYWVKGSNSSTYCSIYELGEEAAKMCIYTLQTIFDKIEQYFDEYRTHPEMKKVIKEISDILKAASVKYGNYLVDVKENGDNSYKFTLMENNKHQWPVGWLYVSEHDNGALYISHGWPLGGHNIGKYCSWEKAKEYAQEFVRATFN